MIWFIPAPPTARTVAFQHPRSLLSQLYRARQENGELAGEDDAVIGPRIFMVNGVRLPRQSQRPPVGIFRRGDGILYAFDAKPAKQGDTNFLKKVWWPIAIRRI